MNVRILSETFEPPSRCLPLLYNSLDPKVTVCADMMQNNTKKFLKFMLKKKFPDRDKWNEKMIGQLESLNVFQRSDVCINTKVAQSVSEKKIFNSEK